jgi:hypothetical protein
MQEKYKKYFWDGQGNFTGPARLQRIIEYASFPDFIAYPFDEFKVNIVKIDINRLRTSENRKKLIKLALPHFAFSKSWEEIISKL